MNIFANTNKFTNTMLDCRSDSPIMNHSVEDKIPLIGGTRKPQPPSVEIYFDWEVAKIYTRLWTNLCASKKNK
jgi:hypothetical protein